MSFYETCRRQVRENPQIFRKTDISRPERSEGDPDIDIT